jgi:hypothetical protein
MWIDRAGSSVDQHRPAMRPAGLSPIDLLLSHPRGERGEATSAAAPRRTIYAHAVLWRAAHDRLVTGVRIRGTAQTRGAAAADDGLGDDLSHTVHESGAFHFVERRWRTVKYEEVYLKDYATPREATQQLGRFFVHDNEQRQQQALGYQTPARVYCGRGVAPSSLS